MSRPWFAFYPGDYGRDTAHLSLLEDGAYRRLLDYCYCTGRPIPRAKEQAFRICRASIPAEQDAVTFVLGEFFEERPDGFHNPRADREILKQSEYKNKLSESGRKGAAIRWADGHHISHPISTPNGEVVAEPQPQPHKEKSKAKACASAHTPSSVDEVQAYCRERNNQVDPQQWFDHYTANGWKVGRNPMKDWRATVRTWERNGLDQGANGRRADQRPNDSQFVGSKIPSPPCPLSQCDGSGWYVDAETRQRVDCEHLALRAKA